MIEIALAVAVFTGLVLALVSVILVARATLTPQGETEILVNERRAVTAPIGETLLRALAEAGISLPSACGGKGTCGLCKVTLLSGGGVALPTERARLTRREVGQGVRLACQLVIREPLDVRVSDQAFGVKRWRCRVRSARCVATLIKEIVLELPADESIEFRAGEYVQVTAPPYRARFRDFQIDPAVRDEWDRLDLWRYEASNDAPIARAYSMANHPGERGIAMLAVRIATPPPGAPAGTPPGIVSSYLFSLREGDEVEVSGPYGQFFAAPGEREMVFVGGGAGMAPLRSHIFDQLEVRETQRRITFWYGARSLRELFYIEDFDRLEEKHPNFRWVAALSEPRPDDDWEGEVGFIHEVLYRSYLATHPSPEDCDYYLCGPPMMIKATRAMLHNLGVDPDSIRFDDFGS